MMEVLLRCCNNHDGQMHDFVMTKPPKQCPKCGDTFNIVPLVRTFLLTPAKDGPIHGAQGRRYVVVSRPDMKAIVPHVEAWTTEWRGVNNPACMRTKEYLALKTKDQEEEFIKSGGLLVPDSFLEQNGE